MKQLIELAAQQLSVLATARGLDISRNTEQKYLVLGLRSPLGGSVYLPEPLIPTILRTDPLPSSSHFEARIESGKAGWFARIRSGQAQILHLRATTSSFFPTVARKLALLAVPDLIEAWYNLQRHHSTP